MSAQGGSPLVREVATLLSQALDLYAGTPAETRLRVARDRFDQPLRVAVAGKVKAGKSTLLNALVGEELAPTDAGECTKIVTWYRNGTTYRVNGQLASGATVQLQFRRDDGPIAVDLGPHPASEVDALHIEWPAAPLRRLTLVDTPGIGSLSKDVSQRTHAFLAPGEDEVTEADAVLYLMRHVHSEDVRFLEAFHDDELAKATPINAIGVLSRADELGGARGNAMETARRIAARYRDTPSVRRLCQTVVPVAGLLGQSARNLREDEFKALCQIAASPKEVLEQILLTVDRFTADQDSLPLAQVEREHLLTRFGLYGVRMAVAQIKFGQVRTSGALSNVLLERSGLPELERLLLTEFAERSDVLKGRSALLAVQSALHEFPVTGSVGLAAALERIQASAHEFAEIRLLNALRSGAVPFKEQELLDADRLLGASGTTPAARLALDGDADAATVTAAAVEALRRWRRKAESPMSSREVADAAAVLVRTCEGVVTDAADR